MSTRCIIALFVIAIAARAEPLRVAGSATVAQALTIAAPAVREELGLEMKLQTESSTAAIRAVAAGTADAAMSTRALTAEDRSGFPEKRLSEVLIGTQVLVFIVAADVWESGVRSITKTQAQAIYEGDTKTWKPLGGPDRALKFYKPERGHGVWEVFATWIYGDLRKAPFGKTPDTVSSGRDARNSVEFNQGTISVAAPRWADGKAVFALALKDEKGAVIEPTIENIQSHRYPMQRPLYLISGDRPSGPIRKLFNFMLSPRGQEFMAEADFVPTKDPKFVE